MEKPETMTVKEWLIKSLSISLKKDEAIVKAIISYQFEGINNALSDDNKSVEIAGFGKFLFNVNKANRELTHNIKSNERDSEILKETLSEAKRNKILDIIAFRNKQTAYIQNILKNE